MQGRCSNGARQVSSTACSRYTSAPVPCYYTCRGLYQFNQNCLSGEDMIRPAMVRSSTNAEADTWQRLAMQGAQVKGSRHVAVEGAGVLCRQ